MQWITLANTQSVGIMRFRTVYKFCALTFIALLFVAPRVVALPEKVLRDVLKLRPDAYVYADYPGVFDDAEGEGITIEAWIYLTERPKDGDYYAPERQWIIFAKPFSYFVAITGRDLGSGHDRRDPEGTTYFDFGVQGRRGGGWSTGIWGRVIPPRDFPLKRWIHIVCQIAVKGNRTQTIWYHDGGGGGGGSFGNAMGRTDAPLLIGGTKRIGYSWGHEYGSMNGYIDEIRVSKGFRYGEAARRKIRPKRRFRADTHTIALWHFDEGPGAARYADSSGNGYTLRAGGSLAVDSRGKLATTWGSLKR